MNGTPYDSPLKATREYITTVSRLLKGTPGEARQADATATTRLDPTLGDFPAWRRDWACSRGRWPGWRWSTSGHWPRRECR